jgi:adenylate cyclase
MTFVKSINWRIKTIGDSYMVASGIPEFHPDHAIQMADFSLELQKVFSDINKELGTSLQIRTGINSGPVVAGVIGKKKFIYDLWGDAVNVASRMESHGVIGKVQVSDSTYQLLKGHFTLSDNGEKEIKGKGPMKTYILEARIL